MGQHNFSVVIPAAGIGKRVSADIPKQYLPILDKTIIEHSIQPFLEHDAIKKVIVSIAKNDQWFKQLAIYEHPKLLVVEGGKERVDSVLNALKVVNHQYVLVHDAARPCLQMSDIDKLIAHSKTHQNGAILACRVRDTMKRSEVNNQIKQTVDRENLWHAMTPQLFEAQSLISAINKVEDKHLITDEASAIELTKGQVNLIEGRSDNIKVTQPEDLLLAEFYLTKFKRKEK